MGGTFTGKILAFSAAAVMTLALAGCDCCNKTAAVVPAAGSAACDAVIPKVELTGHKSQKFEANQFVSSFALELRDLNKNELYKRLAMRRTMIFDAVKSLDIAESNIEQNSVSLTKEWSYDKGERKLVGYVATQHFSVKLDSRKEAAVLSQMLSAEPDVEIYPTQATLMGQDSLQGVIIEAAVKDGMNKAAHYAAGVERSLGRVLYIGDEGVGVYAASGRRMFSKGARLMAANSVDGAMVADETSIADSVEISANVRLTIELK